MTIKVENTLNEIRYAGGVYTDLPLSTSTGAVVNGALSVGGALNVTGAITAVGAISAGVSSLTVTGTAGLTLGTGGPTIYVGSAGPTTGPSQASVLGSLFINLTGTGPGSRMYISSGTGATAWTPFTTAA